MLDSHVIVRDWGPTAKGWEFHTILEPDFALRASRRKLTDDERSALQERGVEAVKGFYPDISEAPYTFHEGSLLLSSANLRLDLPSLYFSKPLNLRSDVTHKTHEAETMKEAVALLTLYSRWKESAWGLVGDR